MSKLIKNTAYYTIGSFITKAVSFILIPLYTNYLSPNEYGIVNSMQVFTSVLLIIFTFGLERSIYRLFFDYKTDKDKRDFLGTVTIGIIIISIIIGILLFLANNLIGKIYKSISFYPYYAYAILSAIFSTFSLVPTISLQIKEKAKEYLIVSISVLICNIIPIIWYAIYRSEGAVGMLKGALYGNIFALIFLIPITLNQINITFKFNIIINTLKYCLPLIPTIISAWIVNMSDRIFIERYFSTYDVGIYSLGYKIGQLVQFLSVSVLMAYNPYFYKLANSKDQINAKNKLKIINNTTVIFLLFIGFLVAFFSKDIIILFFNEKYVETYKIIPIIVLGYFFIQLVSLQNRSFYQEKKTIVIMNINIIAALINIVLNFLFISRFGYYGAAWSTVITQFIFFLIIYYYSKRYYFIPYNWQFIIPMICISIILVLLNLIYIPTQITYFLFKQLIFLLFLSFIYINRKKEIINFIKQV